MTAAPAKQVGCDRRLRDFYRYRGVQEPMDTDLIERLLGLLDRSQVTELEYAAGGCRVRFVKAPAATGSSARQDAHVPVTGATPAPVNAREHRIQAPLSGCFFRASAPGVAPFVTVGDNVAEGDTLA